MIRLILINKNYKVKVVDSKDEIILGEIKYFFPEDDQTILFKIVFLRQVAGMYYALYEEIERVEEAA